MASERYHLCRWCRRRAKYRIVARESAYTLHACTTHMRDAEVRADRDLGVGPIRRHTTTNMWFEVRS